MARTDNSPNPGYDGPPSSGIFSDGLGPAANNSWLTPVGGNIIEVPDTEPHVFPVVPDRDADDMPAPQSVMRGGSGY
jgi:hypothetical protein